jgi:hypothetical protein
MILVLAIKKPERNNIPFSSNPFVVTVSKVHDTSEKGGQQGIRKGKNRLAITLYSQLA